MKSKVQKVKTEIKAIKKKIKIKQKNFNFSYFVLFPKFHKSPVKFITVTCGYNSHIECTNKKLL